MRTLARDFFTLFGAHVRDAGDGEVEVHLPPDLAAHFGKERLYLVFSTTELSPYEDLVVYGSRVFEDMMAWLEGRGERVRWRLPVRALDHAFEDGPPTELTFVNCAVEQADARSEEALLFGFNFRLTYTADDRREEIYTVILDADGQPHPEMQHLLKVSQDVSLKDNSSDGVVTPAKAPTRTRLVELAEEAQARAVTHAETQAAALEADLHQRLHRVLVRLTTYYQRQIDEVATRDEARAEEARQVMEEDLQRKIADELESHRLRVQVRLVSTAQVGRPVRHYPVVLRSRHVTHTLALRRDLHTGELDPIPCHACEQPMTEIALCAAGHVVGADCVRTCHDCGRDVCTACGVQTCAVCRKLVCHECKHICHVCGDWACGEHFLVCPICEEETCTAHSFECKVCRQRYSINCQTQKRVCKTCATLEPVLPEKVIIFTRDLAELQQRYRHWWRGQNARYRIYKGERFLGHIVVVEDRATGKMILRREGGLRARLGL